MHGVATLLRWTPGLVLVERLPAGVERAQTRDAHRRRLKCLADGAEQRLGNCREPIQRPTARPQEEHLDRRGDATIVAEAVADGRDVVLTQREGFPNVVLGQPAGQVLDSDERVVVLFAQIDTPDVKTLSEIKKLRGAARGSVK